jgi:hypothetical protein
VNDTIEFSVLTRWQSFEAIHGFAANDITSAVVEPDAVAALPEFDATVQHYEIIEDAGTSGV